MPALSSGGGGQTSRPCGWGMAMSLGPWGQGPLDSTVLPLRDNDSQLAAGEGAVSTLPDSPSRTTPPSEPGPNRASSLAPSACLPTPIRMGQEDLILPVEKLKVTEHVWDLGSSLPTHSPTSH